MRSENGTTQEAGRGLDSGYVFDKREGLGSIQVPSRGNGIKQIGFDSTNSSRENRSWSTVQDRSATAGKILERLEFIEGAYVSYVKADQERLEVRLSESKEKEQEFRSVIKEIKEEIYNLVSEQEAETK